MLNLEQITAKQNIAVAGNSYCLLRKSGKLDIHLIYLWICNYTYLLLYF